AFKQFIGQTPQAEQTPADPRTPQIDGDTIVPPTPANGVSYEPTTENAGTAKGAAYRASDMTGDLLASGAAGFSRGVTGLADLPGLAVTGGSNLGLWLQQKAGLISPEQATQARGLLDAWQTPRMGT